MQCTFFYSTWFRNIWTQWFSLLFFILSLNQMPTVWYYRVGMNAYTGRDGFFFSWCLFYPSTFTTTLLFDFGVEWQIRKHFGKMVMMRRLSFKILFCVWCCFWPKKTIIDIEYCETVQINAINVLWFCFFFFFLRKPVNPKSDLNLRILDDDGVPKNIDYIR